VLSVFFKFLLFPLLLLPCACTQLFYYPSVDHILNPQDIGVAYDDVFIDVEGTKLHAWYLPAIGDPKGSILFLHGNAGNISHHLAAAYWIPSFSYNVLMLDYRGYGRSSGVTQIAEMHEDVSAAMDYLLATEKKIGVFGQSLGASMAIYAAANYKDKDKIAFVVADSPFASYSQIVREKISQFYLLAPLAYPLTIFVTDSFSPEESLEKLSPIPLLISHGTADEIVPFHHSEQLYDKAKGPKTFWIRDNGKHTLGFYKNEENQAQLMDWIRTYLNTSVRRE
jgi:fermentation-respiration switch protein FrsA (DUF1100 family)